MYVHIVVLQPSNQSFGTCNLSGRNVYFHTIIYDDSELCCSSWRPVVFSCRDRKVDACVCRNARITWLRCPIKRSDFGPIRSYIWFILGGASTLVNIQHFDWMSWERRQRRRYQRTTGRKEEASVISLFLGNKKTPKTKELLLPFCHFIFKSIGRRQADDDEGFQMVQWQSGLRPLANVSWKQRWC